MRNSIAGRLSFSGDKSISHRAALFAAICERTTVFQNFNPNKDCLATLGCLRELGVDWHLDGQTLTVNGRHPDNWHAPGSILDARNSGTTTRLLSGILATRSFQSILDGDRSLRQRPMGRIIDPLKAMGARIDSVGGKLPLTFHPARIMRGMSYVMPVASAQVKSCLLLAGLFCEGETRIIENIQTRDHTERMLGLKIENENGARVLVSSKNHIVPDLNMKIPGDISSAVFFIAAALMLDHSDLIIENVSLNPTRTGILDVFKQMGAVLKITENVGKIEPVGQIRVLCSKLHNISLRGSIIPAIIDEIPMLAIVASQSTGRFEICDAKELRFKESDRIRAIVDNLRLLNIKIDEFDDGFALTGPQTLSGGSVHTMNDHRIAMSFSIADLLTNAHIVLDDKSCIDVSFPGFQESLKRILVHD